MTKDDKINLKLEVYKDKNSGKLSLMAHFDKTAPNIYKDKENFYWEPTLEEKEFLFEAFKIMPDVPVMPPTKDNDSKSEETSNPDNDQKQELTEEIEEQVEEKIPKQDTTPTEQTTDEKPEKPSTFSATTKDTDSEDNTNIEKEDTQHNIDDVMLEEIDDDEVKTLENEKE
jgi:hypothetical protein